MEPVTSCSIHGQRDKVAQTSGHTRALVACGPACIRFSANGTLQLQLGVPHSTQYCYYSMYCYDVRFGRHFMDERRVYYLCVNRYQVLLSLAEVGSQRSSLILHHSTLHSRTVIIRIGSTKYKSTGTSLVITYIISIRSVLPIGRCTLKTHLQTEDSAWGD
jgi:hypothetical protein